MVRSYLPAVLLLGAMVVVAGCSGTTGGAVEKTLTPVPNIPTPSASPVLRPRPGVRSVDLDVVAFDPATLDSAPRNRCDLYPSVYLASNTAQLKIGVWNHGNETQQVRVVVQYPGTISYGETVDLRPEGTVTFTAPLEQAQASVYVVADGPCRGLVFDLTARFVAGGD